VNVLSTLDPERITGGTQLAETFTTNPLKLVEEIGSLGCSTDYRALGTPAGGRV
jgi:hypothetical protein